MPRKWRVLCATLVTAASLTAADAHWIRLQPPGFDLSTSAGARNARDTLGEFEQVHAFFLQAFGASAATADTVHLVVFNSQKEFEPYRINEYAIAYYHQTSNGDYIVLSHGGADTFPIAVHEYVHLLVRHAGFKFPPDRKST